MSKDVLVDILNKKSKYKCKCPNCKFYRHIEKISRRGNKKKMRALIEYMSELLCNQGEELSMAEAYISELTADKKEETVQ